MRTRLIVMLTAVFLVFLYVGTQLSRGLGAVSWIALGVMVFLVFMFPVLWRLPGSPLQKLRGLIQYAMALLSMLLGLTVLRDLAFLVTLPFGEAHIELYSAEGSAAVWILAILFLIAGLLVVRAGPRIRNVRVPFENLPDSLVGTKIAQVSDLHVGPGIGPQYVQNVIRKVQAANADMIVFTGDIADSDADLYQKYLEPFRDAFPVPMYYVPGNHEYYHDGPKWFSVFKKLGFRMLFNSNEIQNRNGGKILIGGILDPTAAMLGQKPDARQALGDGHADLKILLAHQPGIAPVAAKLGFDLQLSGHTHGGQFFPWTLIIRGVHKHAKGLQREGRMWVYVNPGTGHWGPPVRLGTRAEITILHLVKS